MNYDNIYNLIKVENTDKLVKIYNKYVGSRLMFTVGTIISMVVGGCAVQIDYKYNGELKIGEYQHLVVWTQEMEDGATPSEIGDFDNQLSISFDGVNENIDFGNVFNYDHSQAFSVSMWVKPQNTASQRALFAKATNDANVYGVTLYHTATGALMIQARAPGSLQTYTFTSVLTSGVWNNVILTYTGGSNLNGFRVYLNGISGGAPTSAGYASSWLSSANFRLGCRNSGFYYSGLMDEFSIWDTNLSQSAVTEIYNAGTPNDLSMHSAVNSLVSWCRLGDNDVSPIVYDSVNTNNGVMTNMDSGNFENDVPQ